MGTSNDAELLESLSEEVAKLSVKRDELKFESNLYRFAALVAFALLVECLWDRFFLGVRFGLLVFSYTRLGYLP